MLPFKLLTSATLILALSYANAGAPVGIGGASEFTQIMNNAELVKVGVDGAQTAVSTTNQYMMQIQQYRNQLANTVGLDPMKLNAQLSNLDASYQQLANYRNQLLKTSGSMTKQVNAWNLRFDTAKLAGRTVKEQLDTEASLRQQRNSTAIAQAQRDEEIMQEVNSDIASLRETEANIPNSLGMNESIQNTHRTMNKIAYQNTRMIELLARSNAQARDAQMDQNVAAEDAARRAMEARKYNEALRQRQTEFVKSMAPK